MSIGARLASERDIRGLTQAEFAQKAGVSRNTQVNYELNKREPTTKYLQAIRAIGVNTDYVLFGAIESPLHLNYAGGKIGALLYDVVKSLEIALEKSGVNLSPHKKASAVSYLFREAFFGGKSVSSQMIEEVITLAEQ